MAHFTGLPYLLGKVVFDWFPPPAATLMSLVSTILSKSTLFVSKTPPLKGRLSVAATLRQPGQTFDNGARILSNPLRSFYAIPCRDIHTVARVGSNILPDGNVWSRRWVENKAETDPVILGGTKEQLSKSGASPVTL